MSPESSIAAEISLEDLIEMVGDETEVLHELINSFLDDSPKILQAIQAGISTQDAELVERSAHTLKSSSRLFRAEQFAMQCQVIEDTARQHHLEQLKPLFIQLQSDYEVITQVLVSKLQQV